ncbi:MAG: hypothetical protein VYA34_06930 [Myxococcota bacterium]|nr:hypothetical protein [Myxococcota bacterium]
MTDETDIETPPSSSSDNGDFEQTLETAHLVLRIVQSVIEAQAASQPDSPNYYEISEAVNALQKTPGLLENILKGELQPKQVIRYVRDPFGRIIVAPFAKLFQIAPSENNAKKDTPLSRRFLPGFFVAIRLMIGGDLYERLHQQAQHILEEHRHRFPNQDDEEFWKTIYKDSRSREIQANLYSVVASRFSPFEKRLDWFLNIINKKAPGSKKVSQDTQVEPFDTKALLTVFRAIYLENDPQTLKGHFDEFLKTNPLQPEQSETFHGWIDHLRNI